MTYPIDITRPFALICKGEDIQCLQGVIAYHELLEEIPDESVSMLPFSQIKEKNYAYVGEALPIISMSIDQQTSISKADLITQLPDDPCRVTQLMTDSTDQEYATIVSQIIDEIKQGEGCNFVIAREFQVQLESISLDQVLALYKQLLLAEPFAYMTFVFSDGERYFVGASPECHLRIQDGIASMNPISGTLPKRDISQLEDFLQDPKEIYELHKVVDEEMKMMARICEAGGKVHGPLLKEMAQLIHTEYELSGTLTVSMIDALRISLYAPTLTGGPIENACRIIRKYETRSRRYYGAALVIKKHSELDSCITIRTAEIDHSGLASVRAGATIVIDSDPHKEAIETRVKAQGMLDVLSGNAAGKTITNCQELLHSTSIRSLLQSRNDQLSQFLLDKQSPQQYGSGKKVLLLDNGDDFVHVFAHILHSLDITTDCRKMTALNSVEEITDYDCVLIGPGPGNPTTMAHELVLTQQLIASDIPVMGICLGHQLIAHASGYRVQQKAQSTQGIHRTIELFGTPYLMGYYNSFGVVPASKEQDQETTKIGADLATIIGQDGYIDVLKGPQLYSVQFHPESILSQYGYGCIQRMLEGMGVL